MAFIRTDMHIVGGQTGNANKLLMYTTPDAIATVIASGYFNDASEILDVNDVIFVVSSTGGTPAVTITYVNSNASGVVDVVNGLLVPASDTT